jgi:hypothetical protein
MSILYNVDMVLLGVLSVRSRGRQSQEYTSNERARRIVQRSIRRVHAGVRGMLSANRVEMYLSLFIAGFEAFCSEFAESPLA